MHTAEEEAPETFEYVPIGQGIHVEDEFAPIT
jgi:hypothetical protein